MSSFWGPPHRPNAAEQPSSPAKETPAPATPPENQTDSVGLPQIAGVTFEQRDGFFVATGDRDDIFSSKELLKEAGFRWNTSAGKVWAKAVA